LNQVDGLTRLVEDLRVLSLADGAYLSLRLEDVDIASEVSQVLELMAPSLTAAGFYLDMKVESTVIVCDPSRIRQVIVALLENARRYASPGKLLIESRLSQNAFHLTVTDEGPGIPEHLIPFIFEAFQRGDDSVRAKVAAAGWVWRWCVRLHRHIRGRSVILNTPVAALYFRSLCRERIDV
jgi:two-component system sensor histidine kinase AdeS